MTDVICVMKDCKHRSKRPMKKYKMENGDKCYKCTLEAIVISDSTFDSEVEELTDQRMPCCNRYESVNKDD